MGVDVSGGYNQDASAITIIDSHTTKVIADFKNNSISPIDLARIIFQIVTRWYPNAVINVERNGATRKNLSIESNFYVPTVLNAWKRLLRVVMPQRNQQ